MQYKPENVDTDKALAYIESCRKADEQKEHIETASIRKFHEGTRHGLDMAEEIFSCANYEKKAISASYDAFVGGAIRKIAHELGVACSDIVESEKTGDEMCSAFANRIRIWCETGEKIDNLTGEVCNV